MKPSPEKFDEIARWLGVPLTPDQRVLLIRYQTWLSDEAIQAGALGPAEAGRLWDRHIVDALVYLRGIPADAHTVVDVGAGIGLPGIPLAIVRPDLDCVLVDRAERRVWLARRAIRILDLDNVEVEWRDIDAIDDVFDVATFRASLPIPRAARATQHLVHGGGTGLVGVSRRPEPPDVPSAPPGITFALSSEGEGVLDTPSWLLRMTHS